MNFFEKLNNKFHTPKWLFVLILMVIIARIPTLLEPYSYGDEMIYLVLGNALRKGIPLYSGVHDNKPPLLYLLAGISGNLFWFRSLLLIWHIITIYIFWKFVVLLFPSKKSGKPKSNLKLQFISTVVFTVLTTLPFLEGHIANAEIFMIAPTLIAFIYFLKAKNRNHLFLSGLFFSIATLFKVPAAFDMFVVVFLVLVYMNFSLKSIIKSTKDTAAIFAGFLLPILVTFIIYYLQGSFKEYAVAAFLQNVGYLSSFRPGDVREPFLVRNAPLLQRAGIVAFGLVILYWKRKRLSKNFILISSWIILSTFAVALSERPYPHYLVQTIPPLAIAAGMLFSLQTIEQSLVIFPLTLLFIAPVKYSFWYYSSLPYYQRFVNLMAHRIDKTQYSDSFGYNVRRNYKLANYISSTTLPEEKIFVWGDSSAIYALSNRFPPIRYVADYHIKDFSSQDEVKKQLEDNLPKLIIVLPGSDNFVGLNQILDTYYFRNDDIEKAKIFTLSVSQKN